MNEKISKEERFWRSDSALHERFEFRTINKNEADEVSDIEQICFPPNEACTPKRMHERVEAAGDIFLVAYDKQSKRIAGFVNGIATDCDDLKDEFFTDASLHKKDGKNIMICGVSVLPEYRGQGLAREMISVYCKRECENNRERLVLTCEPDKIKMYEKFGFADMGESDSAWGGVKWHQMDIQLNP
ncbi:MAG: GNAT family N-acetyltransferase [Lachnospiraceae bacterium]|nr:GNAT family N-acetyltransferase [Lachnospiraceae bacterium]